VTAKFPTHLQLLECIRTTGWLPRVRLYNATTSELYGKVQAIPQDENTPFYPRSPYAVAKVHSQLVIVTRSE
jgi:GDPmannose 4,6-dehydratase